MCRYFHRPLEPGPLAACRLAQTPLYVRPPWKRTALRASPTRSNPHYKPLILRGFCSLRLSVRTPPFHGGESGSIPLGSANLFKYLAVRPRPVSNACPIYGYGFR